MATAPFIRPLQVSGGTFYSFTSSAMDIGKTFNSSQVKFRFSYYALLNIPDIEVPTNLNNTVQFAAIDGALIQGLSPDNNINLAQSLQNYLFNLEALLLTQPTYDLTIKQNVAERVFFKWLKELGAIQYQAANSVQTTTNTVTDPRFVELPNTTIGPMQYQQVVKYIGQIDIVNNVQNNVNAYTELYIQIPTSDGSTPLVLFETVSDVNYNPDMTLIYQPLNPLNDGIIVGRNYNDIQPAGLSIQAIYDQVVPGAPTSLYWDSGDNMYDIPEHWYDPRSNENAYYTDVNFNDPTTDRVQKSYGLSTVTYQRSRLDGVGIDFNILDYVPIQNNPSIQTFTQFNSTLGAQNFEFNAVLIYYDLYDPNNPSDSATNLYGVLFLNDIEQDGTAYGIPRFQKYMPNPVTQLNGNSYGLKVNLKFDTSVDNVGTEAAINDYSTFSLELFVDALNALQNAATILTSQQVQLTTIQTQMQQLEDLLVNVTTYNELELQITQLQDDFATNQAIFNNTNDLVNMINTVSQNLQNLIQGQTSITVAYNLNIVKSGSGIYVDRSVPNQITIDNTVQTYSVTTTTPYYGDIHLGATGANALNLVPYTNYFRHNTGTPNQTGSGLAFNLTSDIFIQFNDSVTQWSEGQTFRLVFSDVVNPQTNSVIFQTDALNRTGAGTYGVLMGAVNSVDFAPSGDMPIFDITCVDSVNLIFVIDRIR